MISTKRLEKELAWTLDETNLLELGEKIRGKVRDSYQRDDCLIIITTDRISAFDRVLGTIPFKGQILNQLADYWFKSTASLAPNHVLDVPDPNVMVVKKCDQLALEFVVRGYITGVTKTSLWYNYQKGIRNYCGHKLPEGLKRDEKLSEAILTPTTKFEEHDRPVSREQALDEGLIDPKTFDAAAQICFRLFAFGVERARERGLILVDTKYEIGRYRGELLISDEIHTPDSSRYWMADTYEKNFAAGTDPDKLDKEYVREWFAAQGFRGDGEPPAIPDEVKIEAAKRYIKAYELITGQEFAVEDCPPAERICANLEKAGYLEQS